VIEVDRVGASEEREWDSFVCSRPEGLFAHSIAYRDLLLGELGCEAEYLVAREAGEIRGVLPVMWREHGDGRICNSLPYNWTIGGPVSADRRAERALIGAWNERASDPRTLSSTMIENPFLERALPEPLHEITDERIIQFTALPQGGGEGDVTALISSEARNNVRRAARRGVTVVRENGAIGEVHRIHAEVMEAFGAPAKSQAFFEAIAAGLRPGEEFNIWLARVADEVAAALLVIRFNGVSEYFASGTRPSFRAHHPHPALVFTAMVDEARSGARLWNWGGTRHGMTGVFHFKSKWGSQQGRYRYFVHVNDQSLRNSAAYELLARFPGFYVLPFAALHAGLS
jgi:hypothetical protein